MTTPTTQQAAGAAPAPSEPFQGLSAFLRAQAQSVAWHQPNAKCLRDWADEVDRAAIAAQGTDSGAAPAESIAALQARIDELELITGGTAQEQIEGWNGTYEHAWRSAYCHIQTVNQRNARALQEAGFPAPAAPDTVPAASHRPPPEWYAKMIAETADDDFQIGPAFQDAPKDHEIAALVNQLRDIAIEFHDAQQLRQRIAQLVVPAFRAARTQPVAAPLTDAARDVLAERARQISAEGWTLQHDDEHDFGQLARAGAAYAAQSLCAEDAEFDCGPPNWWLWDRTWWKPNSRRGMLVKAGALILAEMERLDRRAGIGQERSTS